MQKTLKLIAAVLLLSACLAAWVYVMWSVVLDHADFNGGRIEAVGLYSEIWLVINLGLLWLLITRRVGLSILLTALFYAVFVWVNLEKIQYFNSTLMPQDIQYADQLMMVWPIFKPYLTGTVLLALVLAVVVYVWRRLESPLVHLTEMRWWSQMLLFVVLFGVGIEFSGLRATLADMAASERSRSHAVGTSEKYGLLTTFVRNALHWQSNTRPADYNQAAIETIYDHKIKPLLNPSTQRAVAQDGPVNLVILLLESFIDPAPLGLTTTRDPIPFFHALQQQHPSGFVYSPEIGGRSANAEFEILTGFSKHFFSHSTIPFIDLPFRPIPSLGQELKQAGYVTGAFQASDLGFFNYQNAYAMLGFERISSLKDQTDVPLDPAGRFPADTALVDSLIQASHTPQPFFLYAFTNSTHGPWKHGAYDDSDLDLALAQPLGSPAGAKQLKTYLNALHQADLAIARLINHFAQRPEKTLVLILGDHQPGMPEVRELFMKRRYPGQFTDTDRNKLRRQFNRFAESHPLESYQIMQQVPYVLWANFELPEDLTDGPNKPMGMNELAELLMQTMGHEVRSPFYHFMRAFKQHTDYTDLLKQVFLDGQDLDPTAAEWVRAYELIQYDLLLGDGHLTTRHQMDQAGENSHE